MLLLAPLFTLLDRPTGQSTAGVEVGYVEYGHMSFDASASRGEAHVEVVDPGTGIGGYLRAPIAHLDDNGSGYSATTFDDVELGGVWRVQRSADVAIVLHAGAALSTAANADVLPLVYTAGARPQDFALAIPHGNTARLGVSPSWRSGNVIAGADLGLDLNISNRSRGAEGTEQHVDYAPIVHADAGIGYALPRFVVTAELASVRVASGEMASSGWLVTGALATRFPVGRVAPYAAFVLPLHDGVDYNTVSFGATAGVDALF